MVLNSDLNITELSYNPKSGALVKGMEYELNEADTNTIRIQPYEHVSLLDKCLLHKDKMYRLWPADQEGFDYDIEVVQAQEWI
jgi:hypothetical protein